MEASSNFSHALSTWKEINLSELQKTLDKQGLEIVENQKENMVGRKKLAEQTREFKKIAEEEKGPAFKQLLKAYQTEIDNLTRRSKSAESSFLSLYKLLAEAPDPFPLLDAAVDQTARASEAKILESEVARQKDEVSGLKAKLVEADKTEKERKRLLDKVEKLEGKMEDLVHEKVSAKEAELHATYDERLRNYEDREKDLSRQVSVARTQLKDLRTTHDSSQAKLLNHSDRQDQETLARLAEADLVAQDLERANSRVAEVERRNEKLRAEIEAVRSGSESAGKVTILEAQVSDLQTEASRLLRTLDAQKEESAKETVALARRVDALAKDIDGKESEIRTLRENARQFADYDEVKRELEIMKYVEFGGGDGDGDGGDDVELPDPNAQKANQHRGKPLENLLMAKNRKLQDELTQLRVAHEDLSAVHRTGKSDLEGLQSRFEEQRALNDRLENDLLRINQGEKLPQHQSGTSTPVGGRDPLSGLNLGKKQPESAAPPPVSSAETSILPIITSQRDRFRQRNAELEEELRRQFETISELRNEIKSLQADNLKLYEKVRYLQSYREDSNSRMGFASIVRGDEELGKYKDKYAEGMNPFERFRGREKDRAVQNLNPVEKIVFNLASVVLSNRYMRNAFVLYALGLHLTVLMSLYGLATGSEAQRGAHAALDSAGMPPI